MNLGKNLQIRREVLVMWSMICHYLVHSAPLGAITVSIKSFMNTKEKWTKACPEINRYTPLVGVNQVI